MGDLRTIRTKKELIAQLDEQARYMRVCAAAAKTAKARIAFEAKAEAYHHAGRLVESLEEGEGK